MGGGCIYIKVMKLDGWTGLVGVLEACRSG